MDEGVGKPTCVCNSAASEMATLPENRRWGQKGVIKNMAGTYLTRHAKNSGFAHLKQM